MGCVPSAPETSKVPMAPMGKCLADMPNRFSPFYWDPILFYQAGVRASHACIMPIAPMGDSRFARCLQGGGIRVNGGSVSIVNSQIYSNTITANYVCNRLQNFPSPRWENVLLNA
jgi:hypothetical protein